MSQKDLSSGLKILVGLNGGTIGSNTTTVGAIIDTAMNTDLKAAISAIDTQAKLLGLMVQKHEVKSDLSTLTDEQIEQRAKALVAKLGKKA